MRYMKMKSRLHRHDINSPRSRHIVNIRIISVWLCTYVLSNTKPTFEVQFMRKLSNTEADVKKSVSYKKRVHFVGTYNKSLFNPFFVLLWIWCCFGVNREKISFPRADFVDSEIVIWGRPLWRIFSKNDMYQIVKRKSHLLK